MTRLLRFIVPALLLATPAVADIVVDTSQPPAELTDKICNGLLDANTPKAPPSKCAPKERPISIAAKGKITKVDGKVVTAGTSGFSGSVTVSCGDDGGKTATTTTISGGNAGTIINVGGSTFTLKQAFSCKATVTAK
jgi:hypothetical protein